MPSQHPRIWCDRWSSAGLTSVSSRAPAGTTLSARPRARRRGLGPMTGASWVAIYPVPAQLAALAEAVQSSLPPVRRPGRAARASEAPGFRLTLYAGALLAMLAAIYGAIYSAQRLGAASGAGPHRGHRARSARATSGTRLPLPSRDEMGFLVHSFNDMTKRLRRTAPRQPTAAGGGARAPAPRHHPGAPVDRGARHRRSMTVRTANEAAGAILGTTCRRPAGRALSG